MKKIFPIVFVLFFTAQSFGKDVNSIYPYPKAAWNKPGQFVITNATKLVIPVTPSSAQLAAIGALQSAITKQIGSKLTTISIASYSGTSGIIIGEANSNSLLQNHLKLVMPPGEMTPSAQGYVLDISSNEILIAGSDTDGTFNGITTLAQLFTASSQTIIINSAHVWDYPDYSARWVFSTHNLLVPSQLSAVENIADTMSLYKLNGLQQNDFKYSILQIMGQNYFWNTDSLQLHLQRKNIAMIPGVIGLGWSSGILYNDPNLAEGLPASATFVMESDTGRLIPNPQTIITNGDFESITNNQFTGWNGGGSFYDGPNVSAFVDHTVFHSGTTSARCTNFVAGNAGGNCRFEKLVNCDSNKSYSLSAWIKTQDLQGGYIQMLVLGGVSGQGLTFTQLAIPSTTDWTRVEVNFNSLSNTSIRLYVGVWGGSTGTMWIDDFSVRESGLCNVLRRDGTPVTVQNKNTGHVYIEGTDYVKIVDPSVDAHKDSYFPYHTPPTFSRITSGAIKNGDSIVISYYHPFASISDNNGNGSVMACVSEDTLYKILGDQITRVNNLYHPTSFFMGHDEIRNMNHDKICIDRHKSASDLLSDNMTKCHDLIRATNPNADILMWSDMVDSLHNAHNNYYLINGDLTGDWNNIPKDITLVNWNGGNSKASLQFFEKLGFKQISSPYYDVGNTSTIRGWRLAQEGVSNVRGMMYTTWAADYNFLRPFAYYAWGAGPNIIHTPLDTSVLSKNSFQVTAQIIADPFDNTDAITSVKMKIIDNDSLNDVILTIPLTNIGGNNYSATVTHFYPLGFHYIISATDKQGLTRILPTYIVMPSGKNLASESNAGVLSLSNHPNPSRSETTINFTTPHSGFVSLELFDILGREIKIIAAEQISSGSHDLNLKTSDLPDGTYILKLETADGVISKRMQVVK